MNIIDEINDLFKILEFEPIIVSEEFKLLSIKDTISEIITLLTTNKKKNFYGKELTFSIGYDSNNNIYLKKISMKDVNENKISFSLRNNKNKQKNELIIKFTDENDIKNIIYITNNYFILLKRNNEEKTRFKRFVIYKNEQKKAVPLNIDDSFVKEIFSSILSLEKKYPTITAYLGKKVPFINDCIESIIKMKNDNIKIYTIKRKQQINKNT